MPCRDARGAAGGRAAYETQRTDRTYITRLATVKNHLSVIELNEPVTQVATGSSSFKIEWRENKVFVQPLEPEATTNLFIWTASGRLSYELVPAASVNENAFRHRPASTATPQRRSAATSPSRTGNSFFHADGEFADPRPRS